MFVPRYQILTEYLKSVSARTPSTDVVEVPKPMFELMLRLLLEQMEFDTEDYLRRNGDVAQAISRGRVGNARQHFINKGFFEGRVGGCPVVDENWYLSVNPDVASEISRGAIASARDHYVDAGAGEWRSPSKQTAETVNEWRKLLAPPQPSRRRR
jgi:hypothetical protein